MLCRFLIRVENRGRFDRAGKQVQGGFYDLLAPFKLVFFGQFRLAEGMVKFARDKNAVGADLFGDSMQSGHTDRGNAATFKFL